MSIDDDRSAQEIELAAKIAAQFRREAGKERKAKAEQEKAEKKKRQKQVESAREQHEEALRIISAVVQRTECERLLRYHEKFLNNPFGIRELVNFFQENPEPTQSEMENQFKRIDRALNAVQQMQRPRSRDRGLER